MKRIDIVNQKFGKLTAISFDPSKSKKGQTMWLCQCDCGNLVERSSYALRNKLATHCGCTVYTNKEHHSWKGCGEISSWWFHSKVIRSAKGCYGARKLKEIDIQICDLWDLFLKQDRKCAYTGILLTFPKTNSNKELKDATASVDRIDSDKGYIKGNVQFVHKHVNLMKNTFESNYFINMCKLIANNSCEIK